MTNCRKILWFAKALTGPMCFAAIGCLALILSVRGASPQRLASHDWTRFNWDAGRSGDATASPGINATNIASLQRQPVHIDGTSMHP